MQKLPLLTIITLIAPFVVFNYKPFFIFSSPSVQIGYYATDYMYIMKQSQELYCDDKDITSFEEHQLVKIANLAKLCIWNFLFARCLVFVAPPPAPKTNSIGQVSQA